jgi:NAD(P)-dependent dehydrogenase (short-subunit alcohol dehydrogenase family)
LPIVRELRDRVAVVTGAASGIGLGIAEAFAAEGMRLVLADIDGDRLEEEARRLRSAGVQVEAVETDVGDAEAVQALADATIARFGVVHIICNNAGIIRWGRTWDLSLVDWDAVLRVNLLGVVHGVRSFVPLLLASGEEGHVINVASMAAVVPVPGISPYSVSKHGVLALSEVLHAELLETNAPVGVSIVMPGRVRTRLGLPKDFPADSEPPGSAEPGALEPAEVASQVIDAVRHGRLHVFTHPERVAEVRLRFARIVEP